MGTIDNPLGDDKRIKLEMPGLGNKIKKVTILQDCFSYPRFLCFSMRSSVMFFQGL